MNLTKISAKLILAYALTKNNKNYEGGTNRRKHFQNSTNRLPDYDKLGKMSVVIKPPFSLSLKVLIILGATLNLILIMKPNTKTHLFSIVSMTFR